MLPHKNLCCRSATTFIVSMFWNMSRDNIFVIEWKEAFPKFFLIFCCSQIMWRAVRRAALTSVASKVIRVRVQCGARMCYGLPSHKLRKCAVWDAASVWCRPTWEFLGSLLVYMLAMQCMAGMPISVWAPASSGGTNSCYYRIRINPLALELDI